MLPHRLSVYFANILKNSGGNFDVPERFSQRDSTPNDHIRVLYIVVDDIVFYYYARKLSTFAYHPANPSRASHQPGTSRSHQPAAPNVYNNVAANGPRQRQQHSSRFAYVVRAGIFKCLVMLQLMQIPHNYVNISPGELVWCSCGARIVFVCVCVVAFCTNTAKHHHLMHV